MNLDLEPTEHFIRDRFLRRARRWTLLIILAGAIGAASAYAVSKTLPPEYRATARLVLAPAANPNVALQEVLLGQNLARSYAELADADVVLRPAMQKVGLLDLGAFRDRTQVMQVRDTFVISVSFRDQDPQRAADAANAVAESFIAQSRSLQSTLQGAISLWQPADIPTAPESPRPGLNGILGGVAAGLVALFIVAIVSYLDDRITDPEQVRRRLGSTALVEIKSAMNPGSFAGKLFVRDEPNSMEAEAFRSLRANILLANIDLPPRTILVTSALPLEGKSVVSANLALAFAQAGIPTILIDADLRRPSQHSLFRMGATPGLTNLLTETASEQQAHLVQVAPYLTVIPSGPLPPNPAELLASRTMSALIERLGGLAENCTVLIDTTPVLAVADSLELASRVDGCLLVVDSAKTHATRPLRAITALRRVNARILGVVLNKVRDGEAAYYYQSYGPKEPSSS